MFVAVFVGTTRVESARGPNQTYSCLEAPTLQGLKKVV